MKMRIISAFVFFVASFGINAAEVSAFESEQASETTQQTASVLSDTDIKEIKKRRMHKRMARICIKAAWKLQEDQVEMCRKYKSGD
jgi:uncharacterized membrane protein YeiB